MGTCEQCTGNARCGWCLASGECLPGNSASPDCRKKCGYDSWTKSGNHCPGGPTKGSMQNVAPEASGLIKPTIKSQLGASGPYQREIDNAGMVRVISGDFTNLTTDAKGVIRPE